MKKAESAYRMGWFIVMFDLPVSTKSERRAASGFRNELLNRGYLMLQFSVYVRCSVTIDRKEKLLSELGKINPHTGNVRCFFITDAQWAQSVVLYASPQKSPYKIEYHEKEQQLKFW